MKKDVINRFMYMGYYQDNIDIKQNSKISNLSVFKFRDMIFMYFETKYDYINPDSIIDNNKPFPCGEKWIQMIDIFHYSRPISEEYWVRKKENKERTMKIVYLKPEKVSEYVFYHYINQEGLPGVYDKFGSIYLYRNMLIMYNENPMEPEKIEALEGFKNLPMYEGNIVKDLSIPWEDFDDCWRGCEKLF